MKEFYVKVKNDFRLLVVLAKAETMGYEWYGGRYANTLFHIPKDAKTIIFYPKEKVITWSWDKKHEKKKVKYKDFIKSKNI